MGFIMKPSIRSIRAAANQDSLLILNDFSHKVLENEYLTGKIKQDTLKVINNLKYIKLNLDYIAYCVEHKNDLSIYKFPTDKEKGVLRDEDGTSFHLNSYHQGAKAKKDLGDLIQSFEKIAEDSIKPGTHKLVFLAIAKAFEWDEEIGCIEKRTGKVLSQSALISSGAGISDEIVSDLFLNLYAPTCDQSMTVTDALDNFLKTFELPVNRKAAVLTYLEDILCIEAESKLGGDAPLPATAITHVDNTLRVIMGGTGTMIQVHYALDQVHSAEKFVSSLQKNPALKNTQIHKASASFESYKGEPIIIVRLTLQQADILKIKPTAGTTSVVLHAAPQTTVAPAPKAPGPSPQASDKTCSVM
jgi:hypothetical protein